MRPLFGNKLVKEAVMSHAVYGSDSDQPQSPKPPVWDLRHVIDSSTLTKSQVEEVLRTASTFAEILRRPVKKIPTLRGKVVANLFFENSTRTSTSFDLAAKYLSADTVNFAVSTSSVKKGETMLDTAQTLLAMGVDAMVIRHASSGVCQQLVQHFGDKVCILNAGDGYHDHPTQGLLDMYSMLERLPSVAGKKIVIVGDIAHSRVARSNIHLLSLFGADVHVVAPSTLLPMGIERLPCTPHVKLEEALPDADVVMCLRLQLERQKSGLIPSLNEYSRFYAITQERLSRFCKPDTIIMHPGPMNRGVEIDSDVADDPKRSIITNQVTSGVAIRMALLYLVLSTPASHPNASQAVTPLTLVQSIHAVDARSMMPSKVQVAGS
jgi:aspartate carbamoyltransferase catalytic subunit